MKGAIRLSLDTTGTPEHSWRNFTNRWQSLDLGWRKGATIVPEFVDISV